MSVVAFRQQAAHCRPGQRPVDYRGVGEGLDPPCTGDDEAVRLRGDPSQPPPVSAR